MDEDQHGYWLSGVCLSRAPISGFQAVLIRASQNSAAFKTLIRRTSEVQLMSMIGLASQTKPDVPFT
jgi:hypothetical protein